MKLESVRSLYRVCVGCLLQDGDGTPILGDGTRVAGNHIGTQRIHRRRDGPTDFNSSSYGNAEDGEDASDITQIVRVDFEESKVR